jgi:hypothetical protein
MASNFTKACVSFSIVKLRGRKDGLLRYGVGEGSVGISNFAFRGDTTLKRTSLAHLICVDPRRVREVWPHVAPLLKTACLRTGLNALDDIKADILSGRSLLWLAWNGHVIEAAAATVLINSEIGKICVITVCGGSGMRRWLPLLDQVEAYAGREGCTRVRIYGRKGWLRVLDGYVEKHIIMDKELG